MTNEELQEVVAAVIAALKTNGKTIDQLTAVTSLADSDNLEVSGGKKVAFSKLKELVASSVVITEESIKGWLVIESTSDLPEEPTPEEQEKAYILDTTLYVYVGAGGDTLDGLYQSVELQGPQGETGPAGADGHDGVDLGEVALINDLTTGGEESALSAEQGKILRENLLLMFDALSEGAFWQGKPTLSWAAGNSFQVINNLDGVTNSNIATTIAKNGTYSATLTSSGDFDVTITMGGVDVTSLVYNSSTGVISIASVTGNIVITAVAEATPVITIYDGYEISTDGSMITSSGKSCTDFIPIEACKLVWSAGVIGNTSNHFNICLYDASKNHIEYFNCNKGYRILDLTTHARASEIAYMRITLDTTKKNTRICYDITNGEFIFKGDDYDGRYDNFLWGKYNNPQSGATQDNILSSDDWAVSDFVAIPANCGSVTNKVGSSLVGHKSTFYDEDKIYKTYYDNSSDPRTITNAGLGTIWVYERISVYIGNLDDCYIKDETNNTYLWKGFNIQ